MFDLDKAIAFWRSGLEHRRALSTDDLDELEQHLRDHTAALIADGRPARAAFSEALGAMGDYTTVEVEYKKVRWGKLKRERKLKDELAWRFAMLKSYAQIAYRTLKRHKGYTAINVLGLAVGMAACLLIGLYVQDELSYDRFHERADRVYRVANGLLFMDRESKTAITPGTMGPALLEEVPDVEAFVRLDDYGTQQPILIRRGHERFYEESFILADSSFFDLFSFPLAAGDPSTALKEPHSVVLTPAMAQKYFGEEDPLGQTIEVGDLFGEQAFRVTGVFADAPHNTHLRFDFVGSFSTLGSNAEASWFSLNYLTYVLLREGAPPERVQEQVRAVVERHAGGNEMMQYTPFLQPLTSIHLHSRIENELGPNGDVRYLHLLSAAALVLLLIACINYMNLATARSAMRAKEVGMRKVVGASRSQLVGQFLGEAVLLSLSSFGAALALAAATLPFFSALTGKPLGLDVGGGFVAGLALSVLAVGLVAGSYPALFLSGLRPALIVHDAARPSRRRAYFRKVLVVAQFAAGVGFIASTLVIYRQLDYIQNKRLGFDKERVVVVPLWNFDLMKKADVLKEQLTQDAHAQAVAATSGLPGHVVPERGVRPEGIGGEDASQMTQVLAVDFDLHRVLGFDVAEGRFFSPQFATDTSDAVVVNEAAVRQFGWEEPLGKRVWINSEEAGAVIGVVRDFHTASLREAIEPVVMRAATGDLSAAGDLARYLVIRIRGADVAEALRSLEARWDAVEPDRPFAYSFLDEDMEALYAAEQRLGWIAGTFAALAVFIASLGLFGLAAFAAEQRTKEIGVRKVLGASVASIVALLAKEFVMLVGVAFVVAVPVAYLAMRRWLEGFAYRIDLGVGVFLLVGALALGIALLTVSYQAVKAAQADPVKALRYE